VDPLLALTIVAIWIALFAGLRSKLSVRVLIGVSFGVLSLTAATFFILGVHHPYTANAYIESPATAAQYSLSTPWKEQRLGTKLRSR
jgi:hypothetical protein